MNSHDEPLESTRLERFDSSRGAARTLRTRTSYLLANVSSAFSNSSRFSFSSPSPSFFLLLYDSRVRRRRRLRHGVADCVASPSPSPVAGSCNRPRRLVPHDAVQCDATLPAAAACAPSRVESSRRVRVRAASRLVSCRLLSSPFQCDLLCRRRGAQAQAQAQARDASAQARRTHSPLLSESESEDRISPPEYSQFQRV